MVKLISILENIVAWIGEKSSYLNLALVILICLDVMQRYVFNQTFNWIIELEWHIFGLLFLLGAGYTLQRDHHVRVDVLYDRFTETQKAWVNICGHILLLVPFCLMGILTCFNYASNSMYIHESSPNPGGLPAWYIIKYFMMICFVLLLLQAIASILTNLKTLRK